MLHEKFPKFTTIPYGVLQVKFYIYYCKAFHPQSLIFISANNAIHLNSHVTYRLDKVL